MPRKKDVLLDCIQPLDKWAVAARLDGDAAAADALRRDIEALRKEIAEATERGDDPAALQASLRVATEEVGKLSWMDKAWDKKDGVPWKMKILELLASPVCVLVTKHAQKRHGKTLYARPYASIDWRATWKLHPDIKSTKLKSKWQKAINLTLQNLKREVREACVLRYGVLDLDMVAAHVCILLDLLEQNGAPPELAANLRWYVDPDDPTRRASILAQVQATYGVDKGDAKLLMGNIALYEATGWELSRWSWKEKMPDGSTVYHRREPLPGADPAFLERLGEYIDKVQEAREWVMERPCFKGVDPGINGAFFREVAVANHPDKPMKRHLPSAFAYLLQSVEEMLLRRCVNCVTVERRLGKLWAPIHDGFNLQPHGGTTEAQLTEACMGSVPPEFPSVRWIVKPFDGWTPPVSLPGPEEPYTAGKEAELAILERLAPPIPTATQFKVPAKTRYNEPRMRPLEFGPNGGAKVVRSAMGTGKTHQNAELAIQAMKETLQLVNQLVAVDPTASAAALKQATAKRNVLKGKLRIVVVVPRISLGVEYHRRMNARLAEVTTDAGFLFYRDEAGNIRNRDDIREADRLVIQIDSVHHLQGLAFDYLVIDESEAVVDQLITSKQAAKSTAVLLRLVQTTKHVVAQDALADEATRRLFAYAKREGVEWIQNDYQPYAEREGKPQMQAHFHWEEGSVMKLLRESLANGKRIFVPCTSRTTGQVIKDAALKEWGLEDQDVVFIQGDDRLNGQDEKELKMDMLRDVNAAARDTRLFIITPSMTVGNSIDLTGAEAFHSVCAFVEPNSIGWRDVLQQLARPRSLQENVIHIQLDGFGGDPWTDVIAAKRWAFAPRICESDFIDYFENVESLRRAHLEADGPVHFLHGAPCLDLDTFKVRRAELESNNALFFMETLRKTEVKNRRIHMVDDIWAGLLHMGAACQVAQPAGDDTEAPESPEVAATAEPADAKTLNQLKLQTAAREHHLVMTAEPTKADKIMVKAAESNYTVTLSDIQRAHRTGKKLRQAYGIGADQWEEIKAAEIARVDGKLKTQGKMPKQTWAASYSDKAIRQFEMLCGIFPHRGDAEAQQRHIDSLSQQEAAAPVETEEEKRAQRKRVLELYKTKTALDLLKILGFGGGAFDTQKRSPVEMLTDQSKCSAAKAVLKWIGHLEVTTGDTQRLQREMGLIASGQRSKTTHKDMLSMLNNRFFNEALGIKLVSASPSSSKKRKRSQAEQAAILATSPWCLRCDKFRIAGFNDDGDPMKPLVRDRQAMLEQAAVTPEEASDEPSADDIMQGIDFSGEPEPMEMDAAL